LPRVALYYCVLAFQQDAVGRARSEHERFEEAQYLADTLFDHFTMRELLSAYAELYVEYPDAEFRRDLRTVVNDTPWNEPWTDTLEALSTLDDAAIIVIERLIVASDIEVPTELLDTDVLGLLTKSMYDPLIAPTRLSRSNYLRGRLGARSLTREQLDLAHTLSLEWTGTLDSLVETVRGLSPR
jgi:hypothetical protein